MRTLNQKIQSLKPKFQTLELFIDTNDEDKKEVIVAIINYLIDGTRIDQLNSLSWWNAK